LRVFLDTNVLASALVGHGLCRDLLDRLLIGQEVVLGEPVREELRRILISKFRVPGELWRELERKLGEFEQAPPARIKIEAVISDRTDVPILACALAAGADVFVTGDAELLALGKVGNLPVLSPRELWNRLAEAGS